MTEQILLDVVEGMDVYDNDGARVGHVVDAFLGHGAEKASATDILTMAGWVSEALGRTHDLPAVLISRLYTDGFIHVNRGLLRRDCVIFPLQIDHIGEESVYLKIELTEVTKI